MTEIKPKDLKDGDILIEVSLPYVFLFIEKLDECGGAKMLLIDDDGGDELGWPLYDSDTYYRLN